MTVYCYQYLIDNQFVIWKAIHPPKSHFRMLIRFDRYRNSNSLLDIGNLICPYIVHKSVLMSSQVIVEISHMIYMKKKRVSNHIWLKQYVYEKKQPLLEKNLISFCVTLLTCDIIGLILPLM